MTDGHIVFVPEKHQGAVVNSKFRALPTNNAGAILFLQNIQSNIISGDIICKMMLRVYFQTLHHKQFFLTGNSLGFTL